MTPRRFWGRDMNEALSALRRALGADALITETKNLAVDLGGGVEITALAEGDDGEAQAEMRPRVKTPAEPIAELREELALLKSMLGWLAPGLNHQDKFIKSLVGHGVTPENISKLMAATARATGADEQERWQQALHSLLPSARPLRARGARLALVGPSGVGKTSTLIKLSLFETQRRDCQVGWVNMDERRLHGNDMLTTYAGIIGARLERAENRSELKIALERLSDCELVLIDTPATNPRDRDSIAALAKTLHGLADLRSALLLSAISNGADLIDCVESYRPVGVDTLVFTKLDESRYLGPLLNTALSVGVPVSYITFGPSFSEDLAPAAAQIFASLLLTGGLHD